MSNFSSVLDLFIKLFSKTLATQNFYELHSFFVNYNLLQTYSVIYSLFIVLLLLLFKKGCDALGYSI